MAKDKSIPSNIVLAKEKFKYDTRRIGQPNWLMEFKETEYVL